ncbi:MAG: transcriptional regulator [Pyrinomonadaceae bacterium]
MKYRFADFTFDTEELELASSSDGELRISDYQAKVLRFLIESRPTAVVKEDLLQIDGRFCGEDNLRTAIKVLRRHFRENPKRPKFIQTDRRRGLKSGYRWIFTEILEIYGGPLTDTTQPFTQRERMDAPGIKTDNAISVRRVTEPNDPELLDAYNIYEKCIPRNEQDEFTDIQRWLDENKAAKQQGNPKLDEYLLVCKAGSKVCGFFYGQYYPSHRLFLIAYLVIDREDEDAKLIAAKELLCRLVAMVRQDHPDCEGIVFEIEPDPKWDLRTRTAKERLFAVHARICADIVPRRLDFEYQQPRLSLWDPASLEERQHLVYGRWGHPPLSRKCAKKEVLMVLDAVYNCWYADCFEDDPERDKEYRAYVRSRFDKFKAELPDEVTLI